MSGTAETKSMGFPPVVDLTKTRAVCEACKQPVHANEVHICKGNAHLSGHTLAVKNPRRSSP